VEIGCGRGEVSDLLRDEGVSAIGVDIDAGMVRRCLDKGHESRRSTV
jgi:cyclopropane fatty-acyl-phospholipid synthase-like methyltransferase